MTTLFKQIEDMLKAVQHGWTTPEKACIMASAVVALRPKFSVEIGVYAGKGLLTLGLAHKAIGYGMAIGVDPYSSTASADGQVKPEDKEFWSKLNHEAIFKMAQENLFKFSVQNTARIERKMSEQFDPPDGIGVLRIDGNHGPSSIVDVKRYAPFIQRGGLIFLDDSDWAGGSVKEGLAILLRTGWRHIYSIDEKENGGMTEVLQKL
jgi:hypothetical protein